MLVLVLVTASCAAALLVAAFGGVVADQRRVEAAADLAALAGAGARQDGGSPCFVAAGVAHRNGGRLAACRVDGDDVVVRVTRTRVLLGHRFELGGLARAGPAGLG